MEVAIIVNYETLDDLPSWELAQEAVQALRTGAIRPFKVEVGGSEIDLEKTLELLRQQAYQRWFDDGVWLPKGKEPASNDEAIRRIKEAYEI